jgi:hypothetical protein
MRVVFVVRPGPNKAVRIVGRAVVFSSTDLPRDEEDCNTWLRQPLNLTNVYQEQQTISRSYAKLLNLISLATEFVKPDRTGAAMKERCVSCEKQLCMHCPSRTARCWNRQSTKNKLILAGKSGISRPANVLSGN